MIRAVAAIPVAFGEDRLVVGDFSFIQSKKRHNRKRKGPSTRVVQKKLGSMFHARCPKSTE